MHRARGDVEELAGPSYQAPAGKNGKGASTERFPDKARRPILRAKAGRNVSQMHYARQGIITPEMEYIAVRENNGRQQFAMHEVARSPTHLITLAGGEATIDGVSVVDEPEKVRLLVGYMPDHYGVYDGIRVWEYLDFFAAAFDFPRRDRRHIVGDVMDLTDLTPLAERSVAA